MSSARVCSVSSSPSNPHGQVIKNKNKVPGNESWVALTKSLTRVNRPLGICLDFVVVVVVVVVVDDDVVDGDDDDDDETSRR